MTASLATGQDVLFSLRSGVSTLIAAQWAVDEQTIKAIDADGAKRFLRELRDELVSERYRGSPVRRTHNPKPEQPGRTRALGITTVKDRVVQMSGSSSSNRCLNPDSAYAPILPKVMLTLRQGG